MTNEDDEIRRVARLLEAVVKVEKVPVRALERQLGLGGGTLNRIFAGKIELKLRHILLVLGALGVKPLAFFRHAFATERTAEEAGSEWIVAAVKDLLHRDVAAAMEPTAIDVQRLVYQTLLELGILTGREPGLPRNPG
jgi:hypothetical protein